MSRVSRIAALPLAALAAALAGCQSSEVEFEPNITSAASLGLSAEQVGSIEGVLVEWFGTPDAPRLPERLPRLAELLDAGRLEQAAGRVESHTPGVTHGLYRRHCARCHGVSGDGRGPTALYQAPYPRDFRYGVFKWKSTYRDAKPTADDLHQVLLRGVPGTAMPSFALLTDDERETLRQYVVYLAVRGEAERVLQEFVADEWAPGQPLVVDDALRDELFAGWIGPIVDAWADAAQNSLPAPPAPSADAVALGRELYHSERAGCYKCHGPEGQGGAAAQAGEPPDYDLWNAARLAGRRSGRFAELSRNDLPVRASRPRELTAETPHGGADHESLYRRVHQGVAGTPMPAVGALRPGEAGPLTDREIAAITAYAQSLMATRSPHKGDGPSRSASASNRSRPL
ncbi:cytochrome c [Botrimarina sp.]|uniref:c-type cytochrome n=1 Tax=Botrimarina sp. TaxID=2795802 RepID=UPI0032EC0DE6